MRTPLITGAMWLLSTAVHAQSIPSTLDSPPLRVMAASNMHRDLFSTLGQVASLAGATRFSIGTCIESRFMLAENKLMILASEMPTSFGNFGTTFRYNGHAGFREFEAGLSYARNLGTRVAAGIRFSHYGQSMPLSASRRVLLADVGSQIRITDKVTGGLQVTAGRENSVLKMPSASFPFAYRLLLGYDLSDKCYAGISWTYQSGLPAATEAGIHYQLHPAFFVRAGFTGIHSSVFAGAGLQRDRFRLLVSGSYHPVLGFSPSLSCQFTGSTKS